MGTRDWRRVLGAILRMHNHEHSSKHKGVSLKTMNDRQKFLMSFFGELRKETPFRNADPRDLGTRHIEVMVERWVARGLATATIHNYLSFLRTFAGWTGKHGMVRAPEHYVGETSPHAHRCQVASEDHSWSAKEVDALALIAKVAEADAWVGLQLELCYHFGMRGKEARHFRPHGCIVDRLSANPRDTEPFPGVEQFVRIAHGTKGGRPRDVPLLTDAQRDLLARCCARVEPGMYVGYPGYSPQAAQSRFYYVVRKFGISKRELGVVVHGLRHEHVNDLYEVDAGAPSPVRGGCNASPTSDHARRRAASVLGHGRLAVTTCYLGTMRVTSAGAANDEASTGETS
ncbi:integrase domain-containing protein [Biomphalaria pfeifferi]|uniref:Integrase domain-containing protein n=1 Tax=Biomphalaria pfeifferi TaxID=112525 RepID=A0AAD8EUQ8_BIOPF|nr:integrase domain-containing protein [Biomphalaria pfeifferi]